MLIVREKVIQTRSRGFYRVHEELDSSNLCSNATDGVHR